jgi:hypothetical protein
MRKDARHRLIFAGCVLITLILAVTCLPSASADNANVLTYTLNDAGTEAVITACDTNATDEDVAAAFDEICSPDGIRTTTVTAIEAGAFESCRSLTSVDIPAGVTRIGNYAFAGCTGLTSVNIPADVTNIGGNAFENCFSLSEITIAHGMTDLPIYFLTESTFKNALQLDVPTSIISVGGQTPFSFDLPENTVLSGKPTIRGANGSFINAWAKANAESGAKLLEISGTVTKFDYDDAWLNVPYQYMIETMMPDNIELTFNLTDDSGALPNGLGLMQVDDEYDGLKMLSGQFYGAPLETGYFVLTLEVRSKVRDYLLDTQEITLCVDSPSNAVLLNTVNDYDITTSIGAIGPGGAYLIMVFEDQIYKIADADRDGDGEIERNFSDFAHFWIDGKVLTRYIDYSVDEGSTVITVYAKTLQTLDDGALHTASAEFSTGGVQTVAAQNFRMNLPKPEPEPEPGANPGPGNVTGPSSGGASTAANERANAPEAEQAPAPAPADTATTGVQDNATDAQDNATGADDEAGIPDDAAAGIAVPAPDAPAPPAAPSPDVTPAPQEIGDMPVPAESTANASKTPTSGFPAMSFIMFAFGAALLISSTFNLRTQRRAVPRI